MFALPDGTDGQLALAFVSTIAHDGNGGIADFFATDEGVNGWVATRFPDVAVQPARLRTLRFAARSAFAASVSPNPPSRVERGHRMNDDEAGIVLQAAINALDASAFVTIGDDVRRGLQTTAKDDTLVEGVLALAVVDFLTGPHAARLRSCQAPRCVRYFVQQHGRQQWCKQSCGNRARVARFADQRQDRG